MWPDRRLIELFKTEFPIVLAPMAGAMDAELVIAAAQGGALGSLPCAMLSADKAREQINIIRQRVSAPVNMNFFCHKPVDADAESQARWKKRLERVLPGIGARPRSANQRRQPRTVRCRDVRGGRGVEAGGRQLSFRVAGAGAAQAGEGRRLHRDGGGDHRQGGDLAGGKWRRRDHRAGRGGRRASWHVPDRGRRGATRHLCAGAAGGRCREGSGGCGRRHRRRAGHRGGLCAGGIGRADRQRLSALPGIRKSRRWHGPRWRRRATTPPSSPMS